MDDKKLVKILKAMGNERRLDILRRIVKGKKVSVGYLSEKMDLSFKSVSKHLMVLLNADLVEAEQVRFQRIYSISNNFPKNLLGSVIGL